MVHVLELAVEPQVDVDHGDPLEVLDLVEERHRAPLLRHHALHDVHGDRADVLVGDNLGPVHHLEVLHAAVVVEHKLLDALLELDVAAARLDVVHHRRAQTVGLVPVQERHLQTVRLVQEPVHRGQHDRHGELIRVDEVERLGHGDEHLVVDSIRHAVLAHEVQDAELVLLVDEVLALDEHGDQRRRGLELLAEGQHLLVEQNREAEVERRGDALDEVERRELAGELLHGEDHLVHLPLQTVLDVELGEQVHHVRVRAEEDVKSGLDPVPVLVLPRGHLPAQHVAALEDDRLVAGVRQVLSARETGQTAADDHHLLLLAHAVEVLFGFVREMRRVRRGTGLARGGGRNLGNMRRAPRDGIAVPPRVFDVPAAGRAEGSRPGRCGGESDGSRTLNFWESSAPWR